MTPSVLFACVAENRPRFATLVENLAISLRSFGGDHRDAPLVALFVDAVDDAFRARLERLDVGVEVVPRVAGVKPLANKLNMLDLADTHSFDVLALLDCDTIVVSDPIPFADPEHIRIKPADTDTLTDVEWRNLFAAVGLPMPERTLITTAWGQPIPPFFNSGVIFAPREFCGRLKRRWLDTYVKLDELVWQDRSLLREQERWLTEQVSLGIAILLDDLPWRPLPAAANFPTHVAVTGEPVPQQPAILHYHWEHDDAGFLFRSKTQELDALLDRFNRRRGELTGQAYKGIRRMPLPGRARRAVAAWFWGLLADRAWYRSPEVTALRKRLKRSLAAIRQ